MTGNDEESSDDFDIVRIQGCGDEELLLGELSQMLKLEVWNLATVQVTLT